jgi:hypothetical protein
MSAKSEGVAFWAGVIVGVLALLFAQGMFAK